MDYYYKSLISNPKMELKIYKYNGDKETIWKLSFGVMS